MLGAEVEVDVAEVSAPAAVTLAGVGLAASAVLAPRVDLALVTVCACPPDATPAEEESVRQRKKTSEEC